MLDVGDELSIVITLETNSSVTNKNLFKTESKSKTELHVSIINKLIKGIFVKSFTYKLEVWDLETLKTDLVVIEYIWELSYGFTKTFFICPLFVVYPVHLKES